MIDANAQHPPTRWRIAAASLLVCAIALGLRLCFLRVLYDGDMELFVYFGKLVAGGGRIGIELLDNKLPSVGLLMVGPWWVIGDWWMGYALLSIAMAIASMLAMSRAVSRVHQNSFWPSLAVSAVWMTFPLAVFSAFKLEHVQLLMASLACLAFIECWRTNDTRDAFVVGLVSGLGAWAKPSALSIFAAACLTWSFDPNLRLRLRLKRIVAACFGVSIPTVVLAIYLIGSGATAGLASSYAQIRSYNHNTVFLPISTLVKFVTVGFILGLPIAMRLFAERKSAEPTVPGQRVLTNFAIVWLLIEIAGIVMQGRLYGYHFLPVTVPAVLLFGLVPRRPRALTTIGSCLPVLVLAVAWTQMAVLPTKVPTDRFAAIDYIKTHAEPSDSVWMDENARVLTETNLPAGSRVPLTFLFSNDDQAPQRFESVLTSDFDVRQPRWIVLPTEWKKRAEFIRSSQAEFKWRPTRGENFVRAWTDLATYVQSNYRVAERFGEQTVYERTTTTAVAR